MGYLDADGYLWHVGRLKRFLKVAGEMVSLIKVEDVLEKLLPGDVSAASLKFPMRSAAAKIVAAVTQPIDDKGTLKKMAEHLPNIALPSRFVVVPEMPKTGSGKIDFRALTEKVRDIVQSL